MTQSHMSHKKLFTSMRGVLPPLIGGVGPTMDLTKGTHLL